jgi:Mg-chelatase subunit ChlD
MSDREDNGSERSPLPAILLSESPQAAGVEAAPRIETTADEYVGRGAVLAALLKILPSYFCSFLGHAVLIAGLSIAASMALRGERIALDGGVVTIGPAEQLEPLEVALDLGAPPSEMQQLQEREQDSAATLADAIAPSGVYAGKDLLEDWGEEEEESELDALVTAGLEESLGSNQPVDKTKGDARFFGVHASGRKFVFIIDCSGSMRGLRWNLAKAELKNSIRNLDDQKEFLVILYNDRTWAMFNRDLEKAELVAATTDSKRRFFQWLSRQEPSGWTRPRLALQLALGQEPDAIFLLSDGELQDDSQHFLLTANQAREMEDGSKRQTPVHTVALDLSVGAGLLEQIAGQNSGVFTHITTAGPPRR